MCDVKTYDTFVRSLMGSHVNDRAVYALGLAGETGEVCGELLTSWARVDVARLKNELGDVCWYVWALAAQLDRDISALSLASAKRHADRNVFRPAFTELGATLARDAGAVVDRLKKHWGHLKPLDAAALDYDLTAVLLDIIWIGEVFGLTPDRIRAGNVEKLSARYPKGSFSVEAANAPRPDAATNYCDLPKRGY